MSYFPRSDPTRVTSANPTHQVTFPSFFGTTRTKTVESSYSNSHSDVLKQPEYHQVSFTKDPPPAPRVNTLSTLSETNWSESSIDKHCTIFGNHSSSVLSFISIQASLSDRESLQERSSSSAHERLDSHLQLENDQNRSPSTSARQAMPGEVIEKGHQPSHSLNSSNNSNEGSQSFSKSSTCPEIIGNDALGKVVQHQEEHLLTSYPRENAIEDGLKASLLSLLSIQRFEYMLSKPETRMIFRNWLIRRGAEDHNMLETISVNADVLKLDRWTEESRLNHLCAEVRQRAQDLSDHYYDFDEQGNKINTQSDQIDQAAISEIVKLATSPDVLCSSRKRLLESLYAETFKDFITSKLLEVSNMKLHGIVDAKSCKGLGDSFCVTNPRFKDNPIVMISPGFTATTGYDGHEIVGKNCRFLQGPGTSQESVQRVRTALKMGVSHVELLLNYRIDGTPFYCLLSIIPLFDREGFLNYYVGGQVNVTDEMQRNEVLSILSQTSTSTQLTSADFKPPTHTPGNWSDQRTLLNTSTSMSYSNNNGSKHDESSPSQKSKNRRLNWIVSKVKADKKPEEVSFKKVEDRCIIGNLSFGDSLAAFRSMYSRLILFRKPSRSIVFITPEALRFLGFSTTTLSEAYSSPLLHHDFLDLVENCKNDQKVPCSKKVIKKIISSNSSASFECDLCWSYVQPDRNSLIISRTKKIQVGEPSVIHLTPLTDGSGECASYVAILS